MKLYFTETQNMSSSKKSKKDANYHATKAKGGNLRNNKRWKAYTRTRGIIKGVSLRNNINTHTNKFLVYI